jgi:emfourin
MRFELTRFGGVAGLSPPPLILETSALPAQRAAELERLFGAVGFWELPAELAAGRPLPDTFSYELAVRDGERAHAVAFDTRSAPAELLELLAAVRAAARAG